MKQTSVGRVASFFTPHLAATIFLFFLCVPVQAGIVFSKVDDTNGLLEAFGEPSLNDSGVTAFVGRVTGFGDGVFIGDPINGIAPVALGNFVSTAWINDAGQVAFASSGGIFLSDGLNTTTIAQPSGTFLGLGQFSLNDLGQVAFVADLVGGRQGVFVSDGTTLSTIATNSDPASPYATNLNPFGGTAINNGGFVSFRANLKTGEQGLFTGDGFNFDLVADTSGALSGFDSRFSLNSEGKVGFRACFDVGGCGVFVGDGSTLVEIARTDGSFQGLTRIIHESASSRSH